MKTIKSKLDDRVWLIKKMREQEKKLKKARTDKDRWIHQFNLGVIYNAIKECNLKRQSDVR